ncbi:MAG: protein kinase domain-containing protein, partial [Betaproteobacteria bacterium]
MRPLWSLVERLGTGGHGEAWLARHDKTHERRVYKFAADGEALHTLKREITIYRLLHDSLGERPDLVHLLDWNLEEPPYFLEYDYLEAGSLATWAKAQGGLDRVPLADRLDLAAQIADALGAAHSVGVLHKDLKPSNVLVEPRAGRAPQIKLCDFGSGGVLDVHRLEQMGITRLGFTKTVTVHGAVGTTPAYLAPEVMGGQPFTVRADIYALGVLLYQLAVGNFNKALAPGWEQDVADEVLREDIALAAEGHPERRIADAGRLAQRLRTLEERRHKLEAERVAKAEAESAKLQMERMRARRNWVRLALAALVAGVTISSLLYVDARRARERADNAAATASAVNEFLSKDMLAQISSDRPLRSLTVKELVDQAAAQVDRRFAGQPAAAAQLHASLGASYVALDDAAGAEKELDAALALAQRHEAPGSDTALAAVGQLLIVKYVNGKLKDALPAYEEVLAAGSRRLGPRHAKVLQLRQQLAYIRFYVGQHQAAADDLRGICADAAAASVPDESFLAESETKLGEVLTYLAEYPEAERTLRSALARLRAHLGDGHLAVASARIYLAGVLTTLGRHAEADGELASALAAAREWT